MSEQGVHYLALNSIKQRLEENSKEYARVSVQLKEAQAMGDLRENSEYDAARESMARVIKERDELTPLLTLPVVRSNDSARIIEEGCVLSIKVYALHAEPIQPRSEKFKEVTSVEPDFDGIVMFGATIDTQELLTDYALSAETPIGKYILGRPSGDYCIPVPGGFAPVKVRKLRTTEFTPDSLRCIYHGRK